MEPKSPNPSFLISTNPEIFAIKPRAGGAINRPETKGLDENEFIPPKQAISRQFRVERVMEINSNLQSEDTITALKTKLVAVSLSCIMMMAAECRNIPAEVMDVTKKYLGFILDEYGNHPPNIQGVLNHFTYLEEPANAAGGGGGPGGAGGGVDANAGEVQGEEGAAQDNGPGEGNDGADGFQGGDGGPVDAIEILTNEYDKKTVRSITRVKLGNRGEII